jgi:hypothetical protein
MTISRRSFLARGSLSAAIGLGASRGVLGRNPAATGAAKEPGGGQIAIPYIEAMPNIPGPFKVRDWRQVALDLDAYLFDLEAQGEYRPLIWIDKGHANFPEDGFGLYISIGDPRCGPKARNGEHHLAICDMPAVIGASLVGIDKSRQHGRNWVRMLKAFFNKANGNNVFMLTPRQNIGSDPGNDKQMYDFWTDTLPSMFAAQLVHLYPHETELAELVHTCAEQFYKASVVLRDSPGGFVHQSFDWVKMKPYDGPPGHHWVEPEASAAFAWMGYMAYTKFGDAKYLESAKWSLDALLAEKENPLYETMVPYGAYLSARMNAERGTQYDTAKLLGWCFSGGRIANDGVSNAKCGEYDVTGLWTMLGRGYLFETFQLASNLVPLTRYDPRFARVIGKWMLNAANSARLFYPGEVPDSCQAIPHLKSFSRDLIAYEVLLRTGIKYIAPWEAPFFENRTDRPFFSTRDLWEQGRKDYPKFPDVTHFSIYSSTSVGVFGGIISRTDDEKILCLDCLKTDYFHAPAYPTHLYFNPHREPKEIRISAGEQRVDLYDAVSKQWLKTGVAGSTRITLAQDSAALIVQVPAGAKRGRTGGRLIANGVVVDYRV